MQPPTRHLLAFASCRLVLPGLLGLTLVVLAMASAHARRAKPSLLPNMQPMQVRLVRNSQAGCEPDCAEWISAEGDIVESTPTAFQRLLKSLGTRKVPVFVNSGGGNIEAAIAIGQMLRGHHLDVSVTRTEFETCAPDARGCPAKSRKVARGKPDSYNSYCASACTLLLAAGEQRLVSPWSHVGVHQIVVFKTQVRIRRTYRVTTMVRPNGSRQTQRRLIREQRFAGKTTPGVVDDSTYRPIEAFLKQMGIGESLMALMEATPNTNIHWMTPEELGSTGMRTDERSGDALLRLVATLPVPPAEATASAPAAAFVGAAGTQHIRANVPVYFQGREIALRLQADYTRGSRQIAIAVTLRHGSEPLNSAGLYAHFTFDVDRDLNAYGAKPGSPLDALSVEAPASAVCKVRQNRSLQVGLRAVRAVNDDGAPLRDSTTVAVPVAAVPGFEALLAEACSPQSAAGN